MTVTRRNPVRWNDRHPDDRVLITLVKNGEPERVTISEHITGYEEQVMKWTNAGHIHDWFAKNVDGVKDHSGAVLIRPRDLEALLSACEKVLFASHLIPAEKLSGRSWWSSEVRKAAGNPHSEIKNVNVAHKTLPVSTGYGSLGKYDAAYLLSVAETRSWCARTLANEYGTPAITGDLYYSWST